MRTRVISRGNGRIWSEMEWNLKEDRGIMGMDKFSQSKSKRWPSVPAEEEEAAGIDGKAIAGPWRKEAEAVAVSVSVSGRMMMDARPQTNTRARLRLVMRPTLG